MVQFGTIQKWKWNFDELWKLRWCFDLLDISWFLYIWFLINRNAVKINGIQTENGTLGGQTVEPEWGLT
jgi:hypothetical protein